MVKLKTLQLNYSVTCCDIRRRQIRTSTDPLFTRAQLWALGRVAIYWYVNTALSDGCCCCRCCAVRDITVTDITLTIFAPHRQNVTTKRIEHGPSDIERSDTHELPKTHTRLRYTVLLLHVKRVSLASTIQ